MFEVLFKPVDDRKVESLAVEVIRALVNSEEFEKQVGAMLASTLKQRKSTLDRVSSSFAVHILRKAFIEREVDSGDKL